ncbi:hypothetical protein [Thalassospira profundimaris]|uniref:hypothetical protein n=1 Tax=Thalassospira profundimaris TaxID=502049 RepID=UPI0012F6FF2C|nr:hypothetical protein [Thalassospira profundimaris]
MTAFVLMGCVPLKDFFSDETEIEYDEIRQISVRRGTSIPLVQPDEIEGCASRYGESPVTATPRERTEPVKCEQIQMSRYGETFVTDSKEGTDLSCFPGVSISRYGEGPTTRSPNPEEVECNEFGSDGLVGVNVAYSHF